MVSSFIRIAGGAPMPLGSTGRGAMLVFCLWMVGLAWAEEAPPRPPTVGIPRRLEGLLLPGTELEAIPSADRKAPVMVQVLRVYPHGSLFRYDIEYTGLEPGTHDLRKFLRRKDRSPLGDLPAVQVEILPVLPPGQVKPNELTIEKGPSLGGYWMLVTALGAGWVAVLVALIVSFFPGKKQGDRGEVVHPPSLAEKLRPLVEGAVRGDLSGSQLAGLERGLLAWWRKRLDLEKCDPSEALERLRRHPEAGPLLTQLESWLHKPGPAGVVDVQSLLEPYRNLPAGEMDTTGGAA